MCYNHLKICFAFLGYAPSMITCKLPEGVLVNESVPLEPMPYTGNPILIDAEPFPGNFQFFIEYDVAANGLN